MTGTATETVAVVDWAGPDVLDAAPVQRADGDLLVLDAQGGISCVDLGSHAVARLGAVVLPEQGLDAEDGRFWMRPRWRLLAGADGLCAAVVFDGGRHGLVLDLRGGGVATTARLDGGDYYPETVPFSACFMQVEGRTVLVHRTAWNRLDASDPFTGRLLTAREDVPEQGQEGAPGGRGAHHLDYFHGELRGSPGGTHWLFDAGWVWQPVGIARVFDVQAWLSANVWEPEDGPSVQWLGMREEWNFPACWIDGRRVAVGGMGDWDDEEFETAAAPPGVRIVEVGAAGSEARAPDRKLRMEAEPQELFSDGRWLWAVQPDGSTSAWEVESGACTGVLAGFAATHLHARRGELLEVGARQIRVAAVGRAFS